MHSWDSTSTRSPSAETALDGTLVSYAIPAPQLTADCFLRHALGRERFSWQHDAVTMAGFGAAAELFAWGENRVADIERQAAALFADAVMLSDTPAEAKPRLFGGFAFRDDFTPDNTWSAFHPAHFILPHYQLLVSAEMTWLTINSIVPPEEDPQASLPILAEAVEARYALLISAEVPDLPPAQPISTRTPMSEAQWHARIEEAVDAMQTTPLNKVVLARVSETRFNGRIDVDQALRFLNERYAGCFRFLFEPRPFHAFFGATPELLVRVHGRDLTTMGLAGSIQRGADSAEDAAFAQQLLASPKDRYEHDLVVQSIRRRLTSLGEIDAPDVPQIYTLSNIQHLYTPVTAQLHEANGVLPLVRHLHPTPALGGQPRDLAMAFIRDAEPVPRGWYAAPIGWIDHTLDGEFGVAIRSAVVQDRRAWLYAGAGIVTESNPANEWQETELKFRPMKQALKIVN